MKKIILGFFVFVLLLISVNQANASVVDDLLAQVKSLKTELSLLRGNQGASVLGATADTTPRIMYWSGKINQHIDSNGVWQTDPDGKSGATIDKLTYCKKWFPNTVSVEDYQYETIDTWRASGNTGAYSSTKISTKCVQIGTPTTKIDGGWSSWINSGSCVNGSQTKTRSCTNPAPANGGVNCVGDSIIRNSCEVSATPSITVLSPNGGEVYKAGDKITIRWKTMNAYNPNTLVAVMDDRITDWQTLSLFGSSPALNHAKYISAVGSGNNTEYTYEYTFTVPPTFNNSLPAKYQNIYGGKHYKILVNIDIPGQSILKDLSDNTFTINPTVNSLELPDLVSGINNISDNNGDVTIRATITNKGLISTDDDFMNVIMIANRFNGEGLITYNPNEVQIFNYLPKDGSFVISKSIAMGNGDFSARVCADQEGNAYGSTGDIEEINENNNCSSWYNFSVVTTKDFDTPSITVLAPNGGETYSAGQQITVKWNSQNIDSNETVWLNLYMNGGNPVNLDIDRVKNTGSATITLPVSGSYGPSFPMLWGNNFKIIISNSNVTSSDYSDNYFSIMQAPIPTNVCVNGATNYPLCTISTTPTIDTGCLPGYLFSPITGQKCLTNTTTNVCSSNILTQKLQLRSTGPQVKILQEMLNSFGYLPDSGIDSKFGFATRQAVMNFQLAYRISPADGIVSTSTMSSMNALWKAKCMSKLGN